MRSRSLAVRRIGRATLGVAACLLVGACASTGSEPAASRPTARISVEPLSPNGATPSGDAASRAERAVAVFNGLHGVGPAELDVWTTPSFKEQYAKSYQSETDIEPKVPESEKKVLQEIVNALGAEQVDKAVALLESNGGPTASATFDFMLATIRSQRDQAEEAVAGFRTAVAKFPKFRRAWRNLGLLEFRAGRHEAAVRSFTKVVELGGADALMYGLMGYANSALERHLEAETAYRNAALLDPNTPDWKYGLARSLLKQRRFADAAALCENLIAATPDRAELWLLQAGAYLGLEKPAKAAENFELVDRLGKSTADSLNTLGDIYVREELFDLAVSAYVRSLDRAPDAKPERALRAARVMASRGALADVRTLLARIEAHPGATFDAAEKKDLLRLRARLAVAEGAGEEETKALQEIVALDPSDGDALLQLGRRAAKAGDTDRAALLYERAAAVEAFEADAKLAIAQLYVGQGRYVDALPHLRRAQAVKPRDNVAQYLTQVERAAASGASSRPAAAPAASGG
jgi:tetratricopeptide (TPR) repeat protein